MKAISLLLLRFSTGFYLILWGIVKFNAEKAARVSDKYYGGAISGETLSMALGSFQILLGVLVVIGLVRTYAYWGQVVWYFVGIVPIIAYIIDPLALYLVDSGKLTFFPSTTLLFASLIMVAFKEYDIYSIDHKRGK